MANGICIRLTHTGSVGSAAYLTDVRDGTDGPAGYQKSGPVYVPVSSSVTLVFTSDVALSYESGNIRGYLDTGVLTAAFVQGAGFRAKGTRTINATGDLLVTDWTLLVDSGGGAVNVNLPPAAEVPIGTVYTIKKISADVNAVSIVPDGAEQIDNGGAVPVGALVSINLTCDGTDWWIV